MPRDKLMMFLVQMTSSLMDSPGQSSTPAERKNARTRRKSTLRCPTQIKCGIIWAKPRPNPRLSTRKIQASPSTTSRVTSSTQFQSHHQHHAPRLGHHIVQPMHHKLGSQGRRKPKSHMSTSRGNRSRPIAMSVPITLHCNLCRILPLPISSCPSAQILVITVKVHMPQLPLLQRQRIQALKGKIQRLGKVSMLHLSQRHQDSTVQTLRSRHPRSLHNNNSSINRQAAPSNLCSMRGRNTASSTYITIGRFWYDLLALSRYLHGSQGFFSLPHTLLDLGWVYKRI